jgi:flavin reductase (DIM6/NTAB) family NADH-FMN oxidoreductase RutF
VPDAAPDFDPDALRTVLRRFATGVAVVTTWDGDRPWGTTVNAFSSVSLRPPLVLVAFDRGRRIVSALRRTGRYAVNVLGEGHRALSDCFAGAPGPLAAPIRSGDGISSGDGIGSGDDERAQLCGAEWRRGVTGLPVLVEAIASLECTVVDVHRCSTTPAAISESTAPPPTSSRACPSVRDGRRTLPARPASSDFMTTVFRTTVEGPAGRLRIAW